MNKAMLAGIVAVAVFAGTGAVYVTVPSLQNDRDAVGAQVREGVERAGRLLAQVHENEQRLGVVIDGLRAGGVESLDVDGIADLVEGDRELLLDAEERLTDIARTSQTRRQALGSRYPLAEQVPLAPLSPRFGGNVPQMANAIRQGLQARDDLLQENERLLSDALNALREGMSAQSGEASGSNDTTALRMEAALRYAKGTAAQQRAFVLRQQADVLRSALVMLAAELAGRNAERDLVESSEIDARIKEVQEQQSAKSSEAGALRKRVDSLKGAVAQQEAELQQQQNIAESARQTLDNLATQPIATSDNTAYKAFADRYAAQSRIYHEALRQAQIIEFGTLENAVIDATGDYVSGEYVPANGDGSVKMRKGLYHQRQELADLEARLTEMDALVESLGQEVESMQQIRSSLIARTELAATGAEEIGAAIQEAYEELSTLLADARQLEDASIDDLEASARISRNAARAAQSRRGEAREEQSAAGAAASRMAASVLAEDAWPQASCNARVADAQLRLAAIYYARYRDLTAEQAVVAALDSASPEDTDPAALGEQAEEARIAGSDAVTEALDELFKASRDLKQHYAVSAQIAAAYYLQSLLGDPDMAVAAIKNYEAAIQGREDSPYVRQYIERLNQIQRLRSSVKN